jgi:hypothetical protein
LICAERIIIGRAAFSEKRERPADHEEQDSRAHRIETDARSEPPPDGWKERERRGWRGPTIACASDPPQKLSSVPDLRR